MVEQSPAVACARRPGAERRPEAIERRRQIELGIGMPDIAQQSGMTEQDCGQDAEPFARADEGRHTAARGRGGPLASPGSEEPAEQRVPVLAGKRAIRDPSGSVFQPGAQGRALLGRAVANGLAQDFEQGLGERPRGVERGLERARSLLPHERIGVLAQGAVSLI
jgi:hypothetical protein